MLPPASFPRAQLLVLQPLDQLGLGLVVLVQAVEQSRQALPDRRVISIAPGVVETAMQAEIRETPERDFPDVAQFHELKQAGQLVEPADVARRLWEIVEGDFENGACLDVRR